MERPVLRPYSGEEDVPAIVAVDNAELEADGFPRRADVEERAAEYRHPSDKFDPARDLTLAFVGDELVGYGTRNWVDTNDGQFREYEVGGSVHPRWRGRGIGTLLLRENERRVREVSARHQTERRRVFGSWSGDSQPRRMALLEKHGYEPVRWFFDMTRPTLEEVPDLPLPDGLELRPITPDLVYAVWKADIEAFRDHWGGGDESDQALQRHLDSPNFDPSLWLIAFDGDEVAGGVINGIEREENEALGVQRGWLHSVFTRRPWRRRGLARALIARSLVLLRERGMTSAVLGVDADNPTGALGLYQSVGFEVSYRAAAWRKPLEVA
ncbi:MAG: GNAT family N-acetyltransferase [Chloroflexota bacterium]|nr:GNAT family N-acetyltransferase [Chloroflexota bacterium]